MRVIFSILLLAFSLCQLDIQASSHSHHKKRSTREIVKNIEKIDIQILDTVNNIQSIDNQILSTVNEIQSLVSDSTCSNIITPANIGTTGYVITTPGNYCLTGDVVYTNPNVPAISIALTTPGKVFLNMNDYSINLLNLGFAGVYLAPGQKDVIVSDGWILNAPSPDISAAAGGVSPGFNLLVYAPANAKGFGVAISTNCSNLVFNKIITDNCFVGMGTLDGGVAGIAPSNIVVLDSEMYNFGHTYVPPANAAAYPNDFRGIGFLFANPSAGQDPANPANLIGTRITSLKMINCIANSQQGEHAFALRSVTNALLSNCNAKVGYNTPYDTPLYPGDNSEESRGFGILGCDAVNLVGCTCNGARNAFSIQNCNGCFCYDCKAEDFSRQAYGLNYSGFVNEGFTPAATAFATVTGGTVTAVTLTNPTFFTGYTSAPVVTFTGGNPTTPAAATSTIDGNGRVISVTITNPGAGYQSTPVVTFAAPTPVYPVNPPLVALPSSVVAPGSSQNNGAIRCVAASSIDTSALVSPSTAVFNPHFLDRGIGYFLQGATTSLCANNIVTECVATGILTGTFGVGLSLHQTNARSNVITNNIFSGNITGIYVVPPLPATNSPGTVIMQNYIGNNVVDNNTQYGIADYTTVVGSNTYESNTSNFNGGSGLTTGLTNTQLANYYSVLLLPASVIRPQIITSNPANSTIPFASYANRTNASAGVTVNVP